MVILMDVQWESNGKRNTMSVPSFPEMIELNRHIWVKVIDQDFPI